MPRYIVKTTVEFEWEVEADTEAEAEAEGWNWGDNLHHFTPHDIEVWEVGE